LERATGWIDAHARGLAAEDVSLDDATGRILAVDVAAAIDVPPFDRASTDGYAVNAADTMGAGAYNPMIFRLIDASSTADPSAIGAGVAVRVAAGTPLPVGADAVVSGELAQETRDDLLEIIEGLAPMDNVERRATHIRAGAPLLAAGRALGPAEIGALASTGVTRIAVVRRPRLCLLHAGRDAGKAPLASSLALNADGPLLRALVTRDGGMVADHREIGSGRVAIREAIAAAAGADAILVTGGTGFGSNDEAAAALAETGELAMHGLALRPGGSVGIGRVGTTLVFLLPGAPASCLWTYELLAGRAVRRLGGREARLPYPVRSLMSARKIVSSIGFAQVCPVRRLGDDRVEPIASFDEAGLFAATMADGFVIVPEGSEGVPQGARVEVYLSVE
jgi:molybdopterin molybdotransferase